MTPTDFSYVWLLPLLERPRHAVEADLQAALDSLPLKQRIHSVDVSLRGLIAAALDGSDYWARLAADWLDAGFPLDAALVAQVNAGIAAKRWEQHTRHRLYRLARRSGGT